MNAVVPINVPQPVKLTIEQFDLLNRSGAFEGYSKTELIEGAIFAMQGQFRAHAYAKSELAFRLRRALEEIGSSLMPIVEGSVALPPISLPEPDIALTSEPKGKGYIPGPSLALAIEVSDSTAAYDLRHKAELYAQHQVPEYWVLEIPAATMHQFWRPTEAGYAEHCTIRIGEPVTSATISGLTVETDGLI